MRRSARRSSSIVRTPSRHAAFSSSPTPSSTRPARAIISISWSVLRLIMLRYHTSPPAVDGPQDPRPDLVDVAGAVHVAHDVLPPVVREHRQRLLQVDADPLARRLRTVVLPHHELGAVHIAQVVVLGRVQLRVVRAPALGARQPPRHPADQHLRRHLDEDHVVHPPIHRLQHLVQRGGLGHRAREAVEEDAALGVGLVEAALDHLQRRVVRHQVAALQILVHLLAQRGLRLDLGAEQVPRRDLRDAEVLRQERGLRTLAAPGRAEQGHVQRRRTCDSLSPLRRGRRSVPRPPHYRMNPRYCRITSCVSSCFMVSSATPTTISRAVPPRYIWFCGICVTRAAPSGSTTVIRPRKIAPANVTRFITVARYSAVGRPGLMPGMKLEYRRKLSATSFTSNVTAV